jgi:Family of unknown function (DUF6328)
VTRRTRSAEELDQEWSELVEELRLALPGAEVLFGFLLVLPFQQGFGQLTEFQRGVYFGALIATAVASVLLISPTVNHRLRWREGEKESLLRSATHMSIAATVCIAFAMVAAIAVITDLLFGSSASAIATAVIAAIFAWFWYGLAFWTRFAGRRTR